MTDQTIDTSIELMGRIYRIKCPAEGVDALQQAAAFLKEKMRLMPREADMDRLAVIAGLNAVHELFLSEQNKDDIIRRIQAQVSELTAKIGVALRET